MRKFKLPLIVLTAVLITAGVGVFGFQLYAQSQAENTQFATSEVNIANYYQAPGGSSEVEELTGIGGLIHNIQEIFVKGIKAGRLEKEIVNSEGQWVGDNGTRVEFEYRLALPNGTSSAAILVSEIPGIDSQNVFITDAYWNPLGLSTTTVAVTAGTSSVAFISKDTTCGADGTCAAATANDASILQTGNFAAGDTGISTSTPFFKADFQGTDTRDGSGTRFVVPVLSTEYLTVNASSSSEYHDVEQGGLFAGYQVFRGYYFK